MSVSAVALLDAKILTTRQLYFWVEKGYLRPENPSPGSGRSLTFNGDEVRVAKVMAGLVGAGMSAASAALIARDREGGAAELRRLADLVEVGS